MVRTGQRSRRVRRLTGVLRHPARLAFAARVGWFIWRLPALMSDRPLGELLGEFEKAPRPTAPDVGTGLRRVVLARTAWLGLPGFRRRNTCYVRALTLYRFLDGGGRDVRVHFGVEDTTASRLPLRGHAWVTVDGELLEGPPEAKAGLLRELNLGEIDLDAPAG